MNERIREFLIAENKSSAQLAEAIGVQPSGISHILSGRNKPSLDFVIKMLEKYKFLSTDWLLFGFGSMYKEKNLNAPNTLFDTDSLEIEANDLRFVGKGAIRSVSEPAPIEANAAIEHKELSGTEVKRDSEVVKIVWFYSNNSFEEFFPKKM